MMAIVKIGIIHFGSVKHAGLGLHINDSLDFIGNIMLIKP